MPSAAEPVAPPPIAGAAETAAPAIANSLGCHAPRARHAAVGGERHRAQMARVPAHLMAGRALGEGRWLLLDEPTASRDIAHQAAVLRAARGAASAGAGVLPLARRHLAPDLRAAVGPRPGISCRGMPPGLLGRHRRGPGAGARRDPPFEKGIICG
ncbi:hypothetical protein M1105_07820 [Limibaculum sp. FT325]|uniref:hypothetical protein n=1 Tax=Thermohalobaculum sediminis TaxID=2939436 RepID=UPI0020BD4A18|nr:hypothetical protein [Limibaculum sediminis]MCL5776890.1 hypothetical protein [Limibaculum sediminis]